jgi:hypothetical protein
VPPLWLVDVTLWQVVVGGGVVDCGAVGAPVAGGDAAGEIVDGCGTVTSGALATVRRGTAG